MLIKMDEGFILTHLVARKRILRVIQNGGLVVICYLEKSVSELMSLADFLDSMSLMSSRGLKMVPTPSHCSSMQSCERK